MFFLTTKQMIICPIIEPINITIIIGIITTIINNQPE